MSRNAACRILAVLATWATLGGCASDGPVTPGGDATLAVRANVSITTATVVLEVTGPDLAAPLVFNIPVADGIASGSVTVPAGSSRTFTLRAHDVGGIETHRGSVTLNVTAGSTTTINLVLTPLTGDVPIDASLGSIVVTVTPAAHTMAVGETVQLTAAVVDENGNPLDTPVSWATAHPGVASVDATGLVTAEGGGETRVVATVRGAGSSATVTVTAP